MSAICETKFCKPGIAPGFFILRSSVDGKLSIEGTYAANAYSNNDHVAGRIER